MDLLCVVLKDSYPEMTPLFTEQRLHFPGKFPLSCRRTASGSKVFWKISWHNYPDNLAFSFISRILYRYITRYFRLIISENILHRNSLIISPPEQKEILREISLQQQSNTAAFCIRRKILIYLREGHRHLNLEGFLRFRLPDYFHYLESTVYLCLGSYLKRRKHYTYVGLLRLQLSMRSPRLDLIHFDADERGHFYLYDSSFQEERVIPLDRLGDSEEEYEEGLINVLVAVAPRNLVLHQNVIRDYAGISETLEGILKGRISFCRGCRYCTGKVPGVYTLDE